MDLLIREARQDDAEAIIDVLNPIIETGGYTVLDRPFTAEQEREFIRNFPERGIFHVAERRRDGKIVGFQSVEPFATYTRVFDHVGVIGTFVDLSLGRQGIGERLSEATFEAARQEGYEKIFIYIQAHNEASLAFHIKLGFQIVGTAKKHAKFGKEYVDEIFIEKFL